MSSSLLGGKDPPLLATKSLPPRLPEHLHHEPIARGTQVHRGHKKTNKTNLTAIFPGLGLDKDEDDSGNTGSDVLAQVLAESLVDPQDADTVILSRSSSASSSSTRPEQRADSLMDTDGSLPTQEVASSPPEATLTTQPETPQQLMSEPTSQDGFDSLLQLSLIHI